AYLIAIDTTPHANRMIVELSARPPGTTQTFLKIPKAGTTPATSKLEQALFGKPEAYNYLPVLGWEVQDDQLRVRHYIDEGLEDTLRFSLEQLKVPEGLENPDGWIAKHRETRLSFLLGTDRY